MSRQGSQLQLETHALPLGVVGTIALQSHHIDHDGRGVVATTGPDRLGDQPVGGVARVGGLAHDGRDGLVVDHLGDAVGAEQDALGPRQREQEVVGVGAVGTAERAGDHVPGRVGRPSPRG